jgi:hypothetical protein
MTTLDWLFKKKKKINRDLLVDKKNNELKVVYYIVM